MILFQKFSLISPLANLIAVPLMSLLIVPLTFLAVFCLYVFEPLGLFLFNLLKWPVDGLFWLLELLGQWSLSLVYLPTPTTIIMLLLIMGSFWLLLPRGWPGRWLGVLLLIPLLTLNKEIIPRGEIAMTVLDVGQGLAVLVRTQNHTLLYDTGDKYNKKFNMADSVIIPYMRGQGINVLNKMVISHSDRDHAGSYQEMIAQITIKSVLAGEPEQLNRKPFAQQCARGQQWQWDDVQFQVLSPKEPMADSKNNNRSCVILISSAAKQTILLTGDIEKTIEKQIIKDYPKLTADVLLVPHHGSKTSSSTVFLEHLQPQIALFSFGYKNRFRHPAEKVIQRYHQQQIKIFNTNNGAIDIKSNMTNNSFSVKEYRAANQQLWHRELKQL